jgi:two-component sensor histidine kinase/tetratricopeptide (TPR) repeat protein
MALLAATLFAATARAQLVQAVPLDSLVRVLRRTGPDTNRVNLLLELGRQYVFKKDELAPDLDTALLLSRQAHALSNTLGFGRGQGLSFLVAAQALHEKKAREPARQYALRAIDLLTRYGSPTDQADAYAQLATYYPISGDGLPEKNRLYEKIVRLYERGDNPLKLADALRYRGDLWQVQGNNVQSLADLRRALALYQGAGYVRLQQVYDLLGFVSTKIGDYETGIAYGLKAMQTAEATKDTFLLGNIYSRLGIMYHELEQPQKAVAYFNKCLAITRRQYYQSTIILLANTLGYILENLDHLPEGQRAGERVRVRESLDHLQEIIARRPAARTDLDCQLAVSRCFIHFYGKFQPDYARANGYGDRLEALLKTPLGQDHRIYIHNVLIPFYLQSKQYAKARLLLAQNEKLCRKARYAKEQSVNHLWWFRLDSALADYPSAIRHYQQFKTLSDSLVNEKTKQQTSLLEVQYETKEKEHRILELGQESELRKSELRAARTTRNFTVTGSLMLVLLLALGYNRYRLKRRSNALLQAQHRELQARQREIHLKNEHLSEVLTQKDTLLGEKDQLLSEKEWLLKEIHHRVKNNLQIVMSLLNSQAASLEDEAALSAIQESQHRVQAMALIHQKLYQSEAVARIHMPSYIEEVVDYLRDFYRRPRPIQFRLDVEPIELDVTQAVPLGLIINEAITNAFKYAFPDGRAGTVCVNLYRLSRTTYQFTIADDGVGLPPGYVPSRSRSLGMTLMHGFSGQLGGELVITSERGLSISLVFEEEQLADAYA